MVHKTISAANELRAPPLAQWKRPKLVNHSRKVGIEQSSNSEFGRLSCGSRKKLQLAMPTLDEQTCVHRSQREMG
jgi:hypothetical protein